MDGMESMGVNWKDYSTMDSQDGGMNGISRRYLNGCKNSDPIAPQLRLLGDAASPLHSPGESS